MKNIIQQNKESALQEFLFGSDKDRDDSFQSLSPSLKEMEKKIKNLQNQVDSLAQQVEILQQKIIQLEHNQNILRETNLNVFSEPSKIDFKTSSNAQQ